MSNDTTTLNGALAELGETMASNLVSMGVTGASASDGLTTLAGKILNIAPSVGGLTPVTSIDLECAPLTPIIGANAVISAMVNADYDDTSVSDIDLKGYLQGATVTFSENGSTLGSAVTDINGVATFTIIGITSGTHTITASFDGTGTDYTSSTATITITPTAHLFYDSCTSSSGLSNYAASECVRGSNATMNMEYDSNENAYKLSGSGNYHAMKKINALNGEDNYKVSLEVKTQNIKFNNIGLFLDNSADTTSYGLCFSVTGYSHQLYCRQYKLSSDGTTYTVTDNSIVANTWYRLEFTVNGSSLNGKLYDMNDNLLASKDVTLSVSNKCMGVFMYCEAGSTNSVGWVRNIIADSL